MEIPVYHLERVVKAKHEDLEDFDGPLDLILHLLSKHKIQIRDIPIAKLLEQYLAWMEERERLNLEVASEFVTMAAHLVYIKTRMLLSVDDEEAKSEMEQLMVALEERKNHELYGAVKEIIPRFSKGYGYGKDYLAKEPEPLPAQKEWHYSHPVSDLTKALGRALGRMGEGEPLPPRTPFRAIVGREPFPVAEKAAQLLVRLRQGGVMRFRSLFRGDESRSEVVATFLAVLELCRANRIYLAGTAEDCAITCAQMEDDGEELTLTVELGEGGEIDGAG